MGHQRRGCSGTGDQLHSTRAVQGCGASAGAEAPVGIKIRYKVIYNNDRFLPPVVCEGRFVDMLHFEKLMEINARMDRQTQFMEQL